MAIPLRRFAYGTHGVGFSGLLNRLNPVGMLFKVVCILATLIPYHYLKGSKSKWILVPAIRTGVMVLFNWVFTPCCGDSPRICFQLHSHWRNTSELVTGLPKLGCGRNVSKYLRSHIKDIAT